MLNQLFNILSGLAIVIIIILVPAAAYFTTRLIGHRYAAQGSKTENIRVLDRLLLGQDRFLTVVQAGDKTLLLGVTQQRIEKLCELDPASISISEEKEAPAFSDTFQRVLRDNWGLHGGKKGGRGQ